MRMTKIKLRLPQFKRDLKIVDVVKTRQQIIEIIKEEVSDVVDHFERSDGFGGWKLDQSHIRSIIISKILGVNIEDEINQAIINTGLVIDFEDGGLFIKTKEPYHPIFMNIKTGKLHVVENSDDKSYIFKFRESAGYVEIGKL